MGDWKMNFRNRLIFTKEGNAVQTFEPGIAIAGFEALYHYFFDNTYRFAGHRHACWEVNLVCGGEMEITYDNRVLTLRPGEFYLAAPHVFHRSAVYASGTTELIVAMFYAQGLSPEAAGRVLPLDGAGQSLARLAIGEMDALPWKNCVLSPGAALPAALRLFWEALLTHQLREPALPETRPSGNSAVYRDAVDFMRRHLRESLSVSRLAEGCYTSPATLKRAFLQYTGCGAMQYFMALKMEAARKALEAGETASRVSEEYGFSSPAYFSFAFKKSTGVSPRDVRKKASPGAP